MVMRTKYHSTAWDYMLPSSSGGSGVSSGESVSEADVETLTGEFEVTLPQGGQADASHVIVGIVEGAETQSPGAGGSAGLSGSMIQALPSGLSRRDVVTWVGDVSSAAAEWHTAHPHPDRGTTKQAYMDEYAPEWDLLADIDGIVMTSNTRSHGFVFDSSASLSSNLQRYYYPTEARQGSNRRFHSFCTIEGFTLQGDGVTLSPDAIDNINERVRLNTDWFERNDPNLLTWVTTQSGGLINPIRDAWIDRANDWRWFAERFIDFIQRNLISEGV
jgi:hypothetical protein